MADRLLYHERVSSNRTEALFLALTLVFFGLGLWRVNSPGLDWLTAVFFVFCAFFLFYAVNYRTLDIRVTRETLELRFGILGWTVPLGNIEASCLDDVPTLLKMGGAGIHFFSVRGRYRASFNFLEYPRVVIALERKVGPVLDISFSTRRPDEVLRLLQRVIPVREGVERSPEDVLYLGQAGAYESLE